MKRCVTCLSVCIVFSLVVMVSSVSRPSTMRLEHNGFKNMVVAIHDSVPEDKTIIDKLKATMTEASKLLFTATRKRAYFKEITILLPSSWSADSSYGSPGTETLQMADVVITNPVRSSRSLPQARSYSGCGNQGVHVLLTQEFLTNPRADPYFASPAKFFIHAFAQFRWGVFQEYAEKGEVGFYFSLYSGRSEAIRCVYSMRGLIQKNDANHTICYSNINPNTGLYEPDCLWRPYPTRQRIKASMMDHQYIQAIETFCDDDTSSTGYLTVHNYEAPSKHNRLCGHRSTWDVITSSNDFKNNANPSLTLTNYAQLEPTFKVLRATSRKRRAVLVVDTPSGMMNSRSTAVQVNKAISELLHTAMRQEADVDVIHSGTAHDNSPIRRLRSVHDVTAILKRMSYAYESGKVTELLGQALLKLQGKENSVEGSSLTVITDGGSASNWTNSDVLHSIIHRGLSVNIIVLKVLPGPKNTNLERPISLPGVGVCYEGNHHDVISLHDCLHLSMTGAIWRDDEHVQISRTVHEVVPGKKVNQSVIIDSTLGRRTSFHFEYDSEAPEVTLRQPSGLAITMASNDCYVDANMKTITFFLEEAPIGVWVVLISSSVKQNVTMAAKSMHNSGKHDPIVIQSRIVPMETNGVEHLALYADVKQGVTPVVGVKVTAAISNPEGHLHVVELWDNGAGADVTKEDGIYSRYFTKLTAEGFYHVTFTVKAEDGITIVKEVTLDSLETDLRMGEPLRIQSRYHRLAGGLERRVCVGEYLHRTTREATHYKGENSDNVPPGRVTDLRVTKLLAYRKTFVLSWTATGDNLDDGKVAYYELFVGGNLKDVRDILNAAKGQEHPTTGSVKRIRIRAIAVAGQQEFLLQKVKDKFSKSFAFAVRAVDGAWNVGPISNVATAGFNIPSHRRRH